MRYQLDSCGPQSSPGRVRHGAFTEKGRSRFRAVPVRPPDRAKGGVRLARTLQKARAPEYQDPRQRGVRRAAVLLNKTDKFGRSRHVGGEDFRRSLIKKAKQTTKMSLHRPAHYLVAAPRSSARIRQLAREGQECWEVHPINIFVPQVACRDRLNSDRLGARRRMA